jgi:hypothetical protein
MDSSIPRPFASITAMLLVLVWFACPAAAQSRGSVSVNVGSVDPVPVGKLATVSLGAGATPPEDGYEGATYSNLTWFWYATGADGLSIDTSSSSQNPTLKATITQTGKYSIFVKAIATWDKSTGGTISEAGEFKIPLTVVGVEKLQINPSGMTFTDVSGTLYVMLGKSLSFKAIPTPTDSTFPASQPVWSGSSGATGTGETTWVTFRSCDKTSFLH